MSSSDVELSSIDNKTTHHVGEGHDGSDVERVEDKSNTWITLFLVGQTALLAALMVGFSSFFSGMPWPDNVGVNTLINATDLLFSCTYDLWVAAVLLKMYGLRMGAKMAAPILGLRLFICLMIVAVQAGDPPAMNRIDAALLFSASLHLVLFGPAIWLATRPLKDDPVGRYSLAYTLAALFLVYQIGDATVQIVFDQSVEGIDNPFLVTGLLVLQRIVFFFLESYVGQLAEQMMPHGGGVHACFLLTSSLDAMSISVGRVVVATVRLVNDALLITVFGSVVEIMARGLFMRIKLALTQRVPCIKGRAADEDEAEAADEDKAYEEQMLQMESHRARIIFQMDFAAIFALPLLLIVWQPQCPQLSIADSCAFSGASEDILINLVILLAGKLLAEIPSVYLERKDGIDMLQSYVTNQWSVMPALTFAMFNAIMQVLAMSMVQSPSRIAEEPQILADGANIVVYVIAIIFFYPLILFWRYKARKVAANLGEKDAP